MSYEPRTWQPGDTVTAASLNRIEQGLANGGQISIATVNEETGALSMTWKEIHDVMQDGGLVLVKSEGVTPSSSGGDNPTAS